jgi:hypothetical protein
MIFNEKNKIMNKNCISWMKENYRLFFLDDLYLEGDTPTHEPTNTG